MEDYLLTKRTIYEIQTWNDKRKEVLISYFLNLTTTWCTINCKAEIIELVYK